MSFVAQRFVLQLPGPQYPFPEVERKVTSLRMEPKAEGVSDF